MNILSKIKAFIGLPTKEDTEYKVIDLSEFNKKEVSKPEPDYIPPHSEEHFDNLTRMAHEKAESAGISDLEYKLFLACLVLQKDK